VRTDREVDTERVGRIQRMLDMMNTYLGYVGCDLAIKPKYPTKDQLWEGEGWLMELRDGAFTDYANVRLLVSEEMWEAYKALDCACLREVKMLEEAGSNLRRAALTDRPTLFKRLPKEERGGQ